MLSSVKKLVKYFVGRILIVSYRPGNLHLLFSVMLNVDFLQMVNGAEFVEMQCCV